MANSLAVVVWHGRKIGGLLQQIEKCSKANASHCHEMVAWPFAASRKMDEEYQSKHPMNQITHQVDGMWPLPSDSSIAHCGPKFFLNWLVSFYRCLWGLKAQLYSSKNSNILTKKRFSGIRWLDPWKVEISLLFGRLLLPSVYWENKTPACPS